MTTPQCPFCPYVDEAGKTHDPLSTQVERTIHAETHNAERELRLADDLTIRYKNLYLKAIEQMDSLRIERDQLKREELVLRERLLRLEAKHYLGRTV